MYEKFDEFLEWLEPKIIADGSVGFAQAIAEFWKIGPTTPIREQLTGRLQATGKYIIERGETSGNFLIRRNPLYKKQTWREKHWLLYDIIKGLITAIFSIGVALLLFQLKGQSNEQPNKQSVQVSDSINNPQKNKIQ